MGDSQNLLRWPRKSYFLSCQTGESLYTGESLCAALANQSTGGLLVTTSTPVTWALRSVSPSGPSIAFTAHTKQQHTVRHWASLKSRAGGGGGGGRGPQG